MHVVSTKFSFNFGGCAGLVRITFLRNVFDCEVIRVLKIFYVTAFSSIKTVTRYLTLEATEIAFQKIFCT